MLHVHAIELFFSLKRTKVGQKQLLAPAQGLNLLQCQWRDLSHLVALNHRAITLAQQRSGLLCLLRDCLHLIVSMINHLI